MVTLNGENLYGYVESSDIKATVAGHMYSGVYADDILENGMLVKLGDITDANEIHAIALAEDGDKVVLVSNEALIYDQSTRKGQEEWFYKIEKGEVTRLYEIVEHDRFSVLDYMIDPAGTAVAVGNYVVLDEDTGMYKEIAKGTAEAPADLSDYGFVGKIFAIEPRMLGVTSNAKLVRIIVEKNEVVVPAPTPGPGEGGEEGEDKSGAL